MNHFYSHLEAFWECKGPFLVPVTNDTEVSFTLLCSLPLELVTSSQNDVAWDWDKKKGKKKASHTWEAGNTLKPSELFVFLSESKAEDKRALKMHPLWAKDKPGNIPAQKHLTQTAKSNCVKGSRIIITSNKSQEAHMRNVFSQTKWSNYCRWYPRGSFISGTGTELTSSSLPLTSALPLGSRGPGSHGDLQH